MDERKEDVSSPADHEAKLYAREDDSILGREPAHEKSRLEAVLELLQDTAVAMNEASAVSDALQFAVDRICAFTGWPVGHAYMLKSGDDSQLIPTGIFHLERPERFETFHKVTLESRFQSGEGLPGRVLAHRQPEWIRDVTADEGFSRAQIAKDLGVKTGLAVPILTGSRIVGVLEFYSAKETERDEALLKVAANIGAQLGRVIERENAAKSVRASVQQLRALTESALEAIITADSSGTIREWNTGAEQIFGYPRDEAVGKNVELIMPDRYVPKHRIGMNRFLDTGDSHLIGRTIEIVGRRSDGVEIPIELSLSTWTARGHRYFAAIIRDISERKESEQQNRINQQRLLDREKQLAQAQRIAQLGSWEWDVQTGELTWSDEMYRIYGLATGSEITYEKYLDLIHPDDRGLVASSAERTLKTGEPFEFFHRMRQADSGAERVLHCEGEVQTDDNGSVIKLVGIGHDVTEVRRAQEELRESERKFRLLAEHMSDVILLQDHGGQLLYVSPSAERILGYDPDELVGTSVFDLIDRSDAERWRREAYAQIPDGESSIQTVVRAQRKDGHTIWLELASKPIRGDEDEVERFLASGRDVSERIRAENEAARYRGELEKRNRELQDFAYVASHDLQEPLRKIRAFSDLIEESYGDQLEGEGLEFLDRVQDAAVRMSTLISDLLSFSRVTTKGGSFESVDLNNIVDGVLSDLEIAIEESDAKIDVRDLPQIDADPVQMRQLFQNLIGNALKFKKPETTPLVQVRGTVLRSGLPSRAGLHDVCRIEIKDNGMGFDQKYADRIFSPFQRLHHRSEVEGTGMGLAICRRIVERHDGTISAESKPEKGTTFNVDLPVRHPKGTELDAV